MVRGGSNTPGKKPESGRSAGARIALDKALFSVVSAAGCDVIHSPEDAAALLCKLVSSTPQKEGGSGAAKSVALDVEVLILDAVEIVLAAYNEFTASSAKEGEAAFKSPLMRASLTNLRSLSTLLSHRPPFSPPVLAALFQLTILVVKHAPVQALDEEGCRMLLCLLELLGCLPRGIETAGTPSIQRVARITARNVMRRVGPRLCPSAIPASVEASEKVATSTVVREQLERDIIPWVERHLLPLHAVTGAAAQADLKEDRRLALSLLDFMLLSDGDACSIMSSQRISMYYLADTVASLLEDEDEGGIDAPDREVALAFLHRVGRTLSNPATASLLSTSREGGAHEGCVHAPPLRVREVREFLSAKDAAYVAEFTHLHERIEGEQENQALLQWQLGELTKEHERVQREIQEGILHSFNADEGKTSVCTLMKGNSTHNTTSAVASLSLGERARNMLSFLRPVEDITIALHEEQKRHRSLF
ncbi:hypothetical protein MOQ_006444 [Trypanosoma cruzi marinkellei]|uniref:Uncharacterized protein n=1 Tax=Trypanosoma cruzi marinkellei TaxID=85056 RepID=K2N501_TRYCR|nr:hypothetical protein MOQ_006444 [Trypanosoma cruzi marinkellei]